MSKIKIITSQNVEIEHELASIADRVLAELFDITIKFAWVMICLTVFSSVLKGPFVFFLFFPVYVYSFVFEFFWNGQTPGKKLLKTGVVMLDGSRPGGFQFFTRWVFRIIDILATLGSLAIVTIFLNARGQRLGDIVAKTTIIKKNQNWFVPMAPLPPSVNEQYVPTISESRHLSDQDITLILDIIHFCNKSVDWALTARIMKSSKENFEKKLGITSELPPEQFLNTLLIDFRNFYANQQ
ncbi:MAG: RDD family protein [Bacteroidota bacterium]